MATSLTIPRLDGLPTIYANAMTEADISDMVRIISMDKSIHDLTIPIPWPYTEVHARQFFEFCRDYPASGRAMGSRHFVIRLGAPDAPVSGHIEWSAAELRRDHETARDSTPYLQWTIGYWMSRSCRGQGIVPALVQEVKKAAEADKRVARVVIDCFTDNSASKRVAEKAGFTLEGTMRRCIVKHWKVIDQFVYSWIPREDKL